MFGKQTQLLVTKSEHYAFPISSYKLKITYNVL